MGTYMSYLMEIVNNLIEMNPYRVLGVYAGDSVAVEAGHRSRIAAFSKVGQTAVFALRGDDVLSTLKRDGEMADRAVQALSLPSGRVRYSLFWYADEGMHPWASFINGAVDSLIEGNLELALCHYERLLLNDSLLKDFIGTVTHGISRIERDDVANMLIDTVSENIGSIDDILFSGLTGKSRYLESLFFERKVHGELNRLMDTYIKEDDDFYVLWDSLLNTTKRISPYISFARSVFKAEDCRYKECAESFASAVYEQGRNVLGHIFDWTKAQTRSSISLRLCRSLSVEVSEFVESSVGRLGLDEDSRMITDISRFSFEGYLDITVTELRRAYKRTVCKETTDTVVLFAIFVFFFALTFFK